MFHKCQTSFRFCRLLCIKGNTESTVISLYSSVSVVKFFVLEKALISNTTWQSWLSLRRGTCSEGTKGSTEPQSHFLFCPLLASAFLPLILLHSFSLTFTIWTYFTEHESNSMSQEEYKKEQLNLQHMFLSLDNKRKVVFKFSFGSQQLVILSTCSFSLNWHKLAVGKFF